MKHFITFFAFIVVTLYLILSMLIKGADLFQWDLSGYGWFWEVYITIQTMMFWLIVLPGLLFSAAVFARFMFVCYSGVFLVWEDVIKVLRTALNPAVVPDASPV